VGLRADLDRRGKSRPPLGIDPRTVQPVGSRYTDCATRPTEINMKLTEIRFKNSTQHTDTFLSTKKERKICENLLKEESINNNQSIHFKGIASLATLL
jgi:hypothetical protein